MMKETQTDMDTLTKSLIDPSNLELILDNLRLGILAHTPERIITVFNREAEKITGYKKEEVIGRDCHEVFQAPFCGGKCSFCEQDACEAGAFPEDTKE